eukprot:6188110-Pleurochrysis_carterae.AAC.1
MRLLEICIAEGQDRLKPNCYVVGSDKYSLLLMRSELEAKSKDERDELTINIAAEGESLPAPLSSAANATIVHAGLKEMRSRRVQVAASR